MRRGLIWAGALMLVANLFVLSGVAYNRSRVLRRISLSEWELPLDFRAPDDSGVSLRFDHVPGEFYPVPNSQGVRSIIDEHKLAELGFDLKPSQRDRFLFPEPRPAFAAFELDGPLLAKWRQDFLENSRRNNALTLYPMRVLPVPQTRLMLADVALDANTLLAKYPDDLVLRVEVSAYRNPPDQTGPWKGNITRILPRSVHVPLPFSTRLRPLVQGDSTSPRYFVTLCVGRRMEPWIESVTMR